MNISYQLKSPKEKLSPIRIVITHKGKVYRKSLGISINPTEWRRGKPTNVKILKLVNNLTACLNDRLSPLSDHEDIEFCLSCIHDGVFNDSVKEVLGEGVKFMDYFAEWAERDSTSKRQRKLTYNVIKDIMGTTYDWDDVDDKYLYCLTNSMKRREYGVNYMGNIIQRLKSVMEEGRKLGYHNNTAHQSFKRLKEDAFAIALTPEEMQKLWDAELLPGESRARDLAWLGYLTASRFSDYSRINATNVQNGTLRFVQQKTDDPVVIPCSPKVTAILERNKGRAPRMCQQVFNRKIKDVCKKVGFNEIIEVPKSYKQTKGWSMDKKVEKWELVSSHTFRRSGATALYKSGVPIRVCRYLTGHKSDSQFLKYIKIDREEGLAMLEKSAFFM